MAALMNPLGLPVGYRFHPSDEEFVNHYLKRRVSGYVDDPCIIPDVDVCTCDPWELPGKFHDASIIDLDDQVQEYWFFSPHAPQQVTRLTPSGYWKKTGVDRKIKARDTDSVIGTKKTLVFYKGRGKEGVRTNWVIHEYHLLTNDSNRTFVLCRLKLKRDKKADNSTRESERGVNSLADIELDLHRPDHEDSFPEDIIQAKMQSLMESIQAENQLEFTSTDLLQLLQHVQGSQNNSFPSDIHQPTSIEGPSFMDISLDNGLTEDSIQLMFGTSEEDEDLGDVQNVDLAYADYGYMQTEYGQTSNSPNEQAVLKENRRAQTIDSVHGFVSLEEEKGMVENKFNSSPVASEKSMRCSVRTAPHRPSAHHRSSAHPGRPASGKCYSKDEELRFKKVKQETGAINVKTGGIPLDETAATAKVGGYKEHGSARNSTKKTSSKKIEYAKEKSNSVAASSRTTSESTKSHGNPELANLVNVLVGFFLLLTIIRQVLNF